MKKVYFVRHGESEGNAGPIRQTAATILSEKGRAQASFVAERCLNIPFDCIVCSSMIRAKETANIILEKISKPIEYSDLFVERRRPSEVLGQPKNTPSAIKVGEEIENKFHLPNFRYSDEENFEDLKKRALAALDYLAKHPEENILVVTHGFFMRIVIACAVLGEKLTGEECTQFIRAFHTQNTGITVLCYEEQENKLPWWIWTWNDHSHLN